MAYWLLKTEPSTWSWEDQTTKGVTAWDGVRNYQASNNMKTMKVGDLCFFYHSVNERRIVGIVEVIKEYYPDHTDPTGRFGMVDVKYVCPFKTPVILEIIKADPRLKHLAIVKQSRLSVVPIDPQSWEIICQYGGVSIS
ncbi:EVE domain-containing protein [Candidatus Paracaedibacter symbiosus]|uniref:EVE domain-containing protein n=1 Tax=Candidatus Paracaedibacter symbiosus TaxID=244582 RepID=UPI00050945E7|nr:EVE domain-containing protein [Candidatus Paracaedibacter symbiosus]